jgi:hypothetical protein
MTPTGLVVRLSGLIVDKSSRQNIAADHKQTLKVWEKSNTMADFSDIDNQVNAALTTQAPAAPPAPPSDKPETPAPVTAVEPSELEQAQREIARLQAEHAAEQAKHEESVHALRLEAAAAIAHKPVQATRSNVQQDMLFDELRRKVGGNCFLGNLTAAQKLESIGIVGSEAVKDSEVKTYFGRGSDGKKANSLRRSDPERYSLLRAIAKSRNLY